MNLYECSDGRKVSQSTIDRKYSEMLRKKHAGAEYFVCEGCGGRAMDNSHIISRKRCKELGKAELIWDCKNVFNACRECHHKWENYKTKDWRKLRIYVTAVRYMKDRDIQGLTQRLING